jgi:hypothetical protein
MKTCWQKFPIKQYFELPLTSKSCHPQYTATSCGITSEFDWIACTLKINFQFLHFTLHKILLGDDIKEDEMVENVKLLHENCIYNSQKTLKQNTTWKIYEQIK